MHNTYVVRVTEERELLYEVEAADKDDALRRYNHREFFNTAREVDQRTTGRTNPTEDDITLKEDPTSGSNGDLRRNLLQALREEGYLEELPIVCTCGTQHPAHRICRHCHTCGEALVGALPQKEESKEDLSSMEVLIDVVAKGLNEPGF